MSKLDKDTVLDNFTKAYTAANGKAPDIEAKGGWYSVDGGKNMRLAQLVEETEALAGLGGAGGEHAKEEAKPVAKAAPDNKAVAPKVEKKKAAPKAKKAKKTTGGFSVKDFYKQQIQERNPGAILPR